MKHVDLPMDYIAGISETQRDALARINKRGLTVLLEQLSAGDAVALLGAGVSAPLYPLWDGLIAQLIDASTDRLNKEEAATCRELASENPEEVVEIVRRRLTTASYRQVLREVLRVRTDQNSGRTWTPVQELICRCAFKGILTTNYDPGIVDARMRIRPSVSATGFTTWNDELGLDRWRTGDVFGDAELPVLYAHGHHNQPDNVVLATSEYRRAYEGKLSKVLERLLDAGHLVWIGFSFADQRIGAILREVTQASGPRIEPGGPPRHVAIMGWDCDSVTNDPGILAQRAEIRYGANLVLYPVVNGDHSPLSLLLRELTDPRFPPAAPPQVESSASPANAGTVAPKDDATLTEKWVPAPEQISHFTGRAEELARISRWAADPAVRLIGITAWGGAGKTALVTHWVTHGGAVSSRSALHGIFGWNFYADPSAEHWAEALLQWGKQEFGIPKEPGKRQAAGVLDLLRAVPLLLVLDGLEVAQEGPAGDAFGRLLDGTLREVLVTSCQALPGSEELVTRTRHQSRGLIILTSRFPFADLETFDGGTARMLEVPAFTVTEGAELLTSAGGTWMAEVDRRSFVSSVDGHALAVGVLAGVLADRPPDSDLEALRSELSMLSRTAARVSRVLKFYADRLSEDVRYLVAAISLFAHPVWPATILELAARASSGHLNNWTYPEIENIVHHQLKGLVSQYPDGSLSAHPLVRDTFR